MASVLTDYVLVFSLRSSNGSLDPPGFKDDPERTILSFTRLAQGVYQILFTRALDVSELDVTYDPAGFDATLTDYEAPPLIFPSLIGSNPRATGLVIAIGQISVGLTDHDFQVTARRARIQRVRR